MKIALSVLLLVAACAPSHLANQAPTPITPIIGQDRVRVTHNARCCTSPSIGIVQSVNRDSLVLQSNDATVPLAIARLNITRIERWNEGETHMTRDGIVGLLAGAVAGGLIGYQTGCGHCDGDFRPLAALHGAMGGGVIGLLAGLIVGSRHGYWETVPY